MITNYKPSYFNAWIWYFVIEILNAELMYLMYYQAVVCLKLCCVCAGDIVELFMRYFRNFGDKSCCVSDLRMFLPLLPNNRTKDFIQNINETVGLKAGELPSSVCLHENSMTNNLCQINIILKQVLETKLCSFTLKVIRNWSGVLEFII